MRRKCIAVASLVLCGLSVARQVGASELLVATTPTNITTDVDSDVHFGCKSPSLSPIRWTYRNLAGNLHVIHSGHVRNPSTDHRLQVGLNNSTGESILSISRAQLNDSGVYSCDANFNNNSSIEKHAFQLSVIISGSPRVESMTPTASTLPSPSVNIAAMGASDSNQNTVMYSVAGGCLIVTIIFAVATICYVRTYSDRGCKEHCHRPDVIANQPAEPRRDTTISGMTTINEVDEPLLYDDALNVLSDCNVSRNVVNGCFLYAEVNKHRETDKDGQQLDSASEFTDALDCNVSRNVVNGCFLYAEVTKRRGQDKDGQQQDSAPEFTATDLNDGDIGRAGMHPEVAPETTGQRAATSEEFALYPVYAEVPSFMMSTC